MTKNTHSEAFVAEMKALLEAEHEQLHKEVQATAGFPQYGDHEDENAQEVADFAALNSTNKTNQERLLQVEQALARIEAGTYGVTEEGEAIPEERLKANPAATALVK